MATERNQELLERIGKTLRGHRKQNGWSLETQETFTNIKPSVMGAYERGERAVSISVLMVLAGVYSFSPGQLIEKPGKVERRTGYGRRDTDRFAAEWALKA